MLVKNEKHVIAFYVAILLVTFLLYLPGLNGALYYDDIRPIEKLRQLANTENVLQFIFAEDSGPVGRSISMMSFWLHHVVGATDTKSLLTINVGIHLLNATLVGLITYLLAILTTQNREQIRRKAATTGLIGLAVWGLLPIHAATVLIAIQRMAELSTLFMLLGMAAYCYGLVLQLRLHHKTGTADLKLSHFPVLLQLSGILVGTCLAVFSKENGILLPILVLAVELTLLCQISAIDKFRRLRTTAALISLLVILGYLIYTVVFEGHSTQGRYFTPIERLVNQPLVLLDYLKLAFIPEVIRINPFHDSLYVKSSLLSSLSCVLFVACIVGAILFRKRFPVLSFAILWFTFANILESTVINLEPVFLHRSYLALIGPAIALAFFIGSNTNLKIEKVKYIGLSLYLAVLSFQLFQTSSTWGTPLYASYVWNNEQTESNRAKEHLALQLFNQGHADKSLALLSKATLQCDDCGGLSAQTLFSACLANDATQVQTQYNNLLSLAVKTRNTRPIPSKLNITYSAVKNGDCQLVSVEQLKQLNKAFVNAPASPFNSPIGFYQNLYVISMAEQDVTSATKWLMEAWQHQKAFVLARELLLLSNDSILNRTVVREFCNETPKSIFLDHIHQHECTQLQTILRQRK